MRTTPTLWAIAFCWLLVTLCTACQNKKACRVAGTQHIGNSLIKSGYCSQELLLWRYDSPEQKLFLRHTRAPSSCAAELSTAVKKRGRGYIVTEVNAPVTYEGCDEDAGCSGRAYCSCPVDYNAAIDKVDINATPDVDIQLLLHITDGDPDRYPRELYQGTLGLQSGSGSIVLNDGEFFSCPR